MQKLGKLFPKIVPDWTANLLVLNVIIGWGLPIVKWEVFVFVNEIIFKLLNLLLQDNIRITSLQYYERDIE